MVQSPPAKVLRDLLSQTPLLIDQSRDGPIFQNALGSMPTPQLQAFYRRLGAEERRRFHYMANVCLGYESWTRLFRELVVQETQARLADRLEDAYSHKSEELRQWEEALAAERQNLEEQLMHLEVENQALRRENMRLQEELEQMRGVHLGLQGRQEQTLKLIERYKTLIADLRRLLPKSPADPEGSQGPPEDSPAPWQLISVQPGGRRRSPFLTPPARAVLSCIYKPLIS
jgi:hypothetical protein